VIRKSALAGHAASIQHTSTCVGYLNLFKLAPEVKVFRESTRESAFAVQENAMIALRKRANLYDQRRYRALDMLADPKNISVGVHDALGHYDTLEGVRA
jgi:hypothetical protein